MNKPTSKSSGTETPHSDTNIRVQVGGIPFQIPLSFRAGDEQFISFKALIGHRVALTIDEETKGFSGGGESRFISLQSLPAGTHKVHILVTDSSGVKHTEEKVIEVLSSSGVPPTEGGFTPSTSDWHQKFSSEYILAMIASSRKV